MTITACRACAATDLRRVFDLGDQHLSDFRDDDTWPPIYPLRLLLCAKCLLVQLDETTPREFMYHDNYGFYSGVNEGIRKDLQSAVTEGLTWKPSAASWLDIASNDGTLLSFVPPRLYRVGVDPVAKFKPAAERHADRIIADYFTHDALSTPVALDETTLDEVGAAVLGRDAFDVVTSISVFYDVDDPGRFVDEVRASMTRNGVWVMQMNYLMAMLANNSVDTISHEHITYWSLLALNRLLRAHGVRIVTCSTSPVNGGSIRVVAARTDSYYQSDANVAAQIRAEAAFGLHKPRAYREFAQRSERELGRLSALVDTYLGEGKTIGVYAASTRGGTIWQAADLSPKEILYAVERNPDKVGKRFSALGVPIISEAEMRADPPDVLLVGPWWFRDQILERERAFLAHGGRMVFPLPTVEVVGRAGKVLPH